MTLTRTLAPLAFAVMLVMAGMPASAANSSMPDTWTIDDEHDLTSDSTIETYQADGVVGADLDQFNARLSVADDHDDLNISGIRADSTHTFVQLEYRESISRTVRIYLPSEYVRPYRETELDSLDSDATAELTPVDNRNYTAIKFTVDEPGTYSFALNEIRGGISEGRQTSRDLVKNSTGWTLPSLGGAGQWEYIQSSELSGTSAAQINISPDEHAVVQYQAGDNESDNWLTVPKCDGSDHEVCYYTKAGVNDTVFVRSGVDEPPQVRYKTSGGGLVEKASAYIREAQNAVSQMVDDLDSLFGLDSNG